MQWDFFTYQMISLKADNVTDKLFQELIKIKGKHDIVM